MARLYSVSLMLLFVAGKPLLLTGAKFGADKVKLSLLNYAPSTSHQFTCSSTSGERSATNYRQVAKFGFEPGDKAPSFEIVTLDGKFVHPPADKLNYSLIIHAYTNKSAFLECMWTSESSLRDLVQSFPDTSQALFVSLDDTAAIDAQWMRGQIQRLSITRRHEDLLSRLHFSPVPVCELGNWIPDVLYSWDCVGVNCGLFQAVFTSPEWQIPLVTKRLDARYDWLMAHWDQRSYTVVDAGDGCTPSAAVGKAVAWVSEGNCSFYTKVRNMANSNASGVLVYASLGNPIQDMNCEDTECYVALGIPASMVHLETGVGLALRKGQPVNVSFQVTPSPNFFIGIDQQGSLAEMGWFLYPSFQFINWQAQWFDFSARLQQQLSGPAHVVTVLEKAVMQGEDGAVATVDLPSGVMDFDVLELDVSLSCPGKRDVTCAPWDHTVQLYVCCDHFSTLCGVELGRWITAFRRGIGHWLTDVSPLMPVLNSARCSFTMKTVPWAKPWVSSLQLRFAHSGRSGNYSDQLRSFGVLPLYNGGVFDKDYNKRYHPVSFTVPASAKKVEVYAVITGHGSDNNGCGEFCVTSHHFLVNGIHNNTWVFDSAGTALGCTLKVKEGAVPNEHGTWLYGRGGWCDGLQVDPWRIDITGQVKMTETNTLLYFGLFDGHDPNPTTDPGYIIMYSYLVFYK